jgi:hypothetical protein
MQGMKEGNVLAHVTDLNNKADKESAPNGEQKTSSLQYFQAFGKQCIDIHPFTMNLRENLACLDEFLKKLGTMKIRGWCFNRENGQVIRDFSTRCTFIKIT